MVKVFIFWLICGFYRTFRLSERKGQEQTQDTSIKTQDHDESLELRVMSREHVSGKQMQSRTCSSFAECEKRLM
jgi:hypothetical protein